jgi:cell division septation protein DedD
MQLRLVAGPLGDAAAAAKICAGLIANDRSCETTVFDGQRLAMTTDEPAVAAPKPAKPVARRRSSSRRAAVEQPAPKPEPSTLSTWFSRR